MAKLNLSFLGPPHLELEGRPITLQRRKTLALLIYLVVTHQSHRRDSLAARLWPDSSQKNARASLSRELSILNKILGPGWLIVERETIGLAQAPDLWLDVAQFEEHLAACRTHGHPAGEVCPACLEPLSEATKLYRDHFLTGFSLSDCPDFDTWQTIQTESLRQALAGALARLIRLHRAQEDDQAAIAYARRWLAFDPLAETAHRHLMQLYAQTGQQAAALRQYQLCVQTLKDELGLPPSAETTALYERLRAGDLSRDRQGLGVRDQGLDVIQPPTPGPQPLVPPHNLPLQLTPFVGRETELAQIATRLADPTCRLLTLVGPGGSGKTRLALQAAQDLVESPTGETPFSYGLYFVPLEAVSSADFLVSAIAEALDFAFYRDVTPKQQLLDYLREKTILLILDNLEHLLSGADLVTDILVLAPRVKVVVTSRESLNLQGEWLFPVDGLPFPESEETKVASLEEYQAIQLFIQCARRVRPGFSLAKEKEAVVRICQLVEGMPLGIELAAAWLKLFPCHKIAQEIERSLDFLTTSQRNVPARHRSMRAIIGRSWDLLSEAERGVLRRLAVFRGGFQGEAAEQIAGATFPILIALVEKSLLRLTPEGRYQMHELLQQFAEERLQSAPKEKEETQHLHCDYYLTFLQRREASLKGEQQQATLAEIRAEIENVGLGWIWAVDQGKVDQIDQALESLYEFYHTRSRFWEGKEAFEKAVTQLQPTRAPEPGSQDQKTQGVLAKLLARQGAFCEALGLYEPAKEFLQQSLALARDLNVRQEIAFALNALGDVVGQQGKFSEAEQRFQESLTISQELGNQAEVAYSLYRLGWVAQEQGAYPEAKQRYQESLMIGRAIRHQDWMAYCLDRLGAVAFFLGEYREAEQYYQESLAISNEIGNRVNQAMALGGLGWAAWGLGDARLAGAAKSSIEESLAICREIGHRWHTAGRLGMLGDVANSLEEYEAARQAFREALAICREIGHSGGVGVAFWGLGEAACGRGDFQTSRKYLSEALKITMNTRFFPHALHALCVWATLLIRECDFLGESSPARERKKERALELLALIMHHPFTWQIYKDQSAHLLAKLKAELPPKVVASALERGKARDLAATVAELLAESESQ
jgi:predicted ATPase/DNA-binding SARP family transcriptional activator